MKLYITLVLLANVFQTKEINSNVNIYELKIKEDFLNARKAWFQHKNKNKFSEKRQLRIKSQQCMLDDCFPILGDSSGSCGVCKKECMAEFMSGMNGNKTKKGDNDNNRRKWRGKNNRKRQNNKGRRGNRKQANKKNPRKKIVWQKKKACNQECGEKCDKVTVGIMKSFMKCKSGCKKDMRGARKNNKQ